MRSLEAVVTWPLRVTFPDGLVGIASWQHFVLEPVPDHRHIWMLQCEDDPEVCFMLVDPRIADAGYEPKPEAEDRVKLGAAAAEDLVVVCTARLNADLGSMTVNLLGPLLVNPQTQLGMQTVLYDSAYATDHPAPVPARSLAAAS